MLLCSALTAPMLWCHCQTTSHPSSAAHALVVAGRQCHHAVAGDGLLIQLQGGHPPARQLLRQCAVAVAQHVTVQAVHRVEPWAFSRAGPQSNIS